MSEVKTNKISSLASNNDITIDPDGTGDTIIASGKVGIGTTSPSDHLSVVTSGSNAQLSVDRSDGGAGRTVLIHSSTGGQLQTTGSVPLLFGTADTERMRILADGRTTIGHNAAINISILGISNRNATSDRMFAVHNAGGTSGYFNQIAFRNNADSATIGEIVRVNDASVSYNTTSDYRLKTAVNYDWDATTRLKQLKPARFEWIADGDDAVPVDGFLAHEAQTVVPEAVTGIHNEVEVWKDGEELPDGVSVGDNKLDDDGNTIPVMQGIDQSKLVPLLVKTIIELEARITALEAE
jgi:hypothetical protein